MIHELINCRFCGCSLTIVNIAKHNPRTFRKECQQCRNKITKLFNHEKKITILDKVKLFCKNVIKKIGSK